ncbi:MAG TPA: hypothetical protein VM008_02460 [Phycisphaerae bacterium]|nr:hypothetical protein [Phycisphaerae bacterium]
MKKVRFMIHGAAALLVAATLVACGVPREAGSIAAQHAAAATMPADDAAVEQRLQQEAAAWAALSQLLKKQEFGGITGVDAGFVQLIDQTAALAKRDGDIVANGQDNAALNRQSLQRFNDLWHQADQYLNQ